MLDADTKALLDLLAIAHRKSRNVEDYMRNFGTPWQAHRPNHPDYDETKLRALIQAEKLAHAAYQNACKALES